jgi:putative transposase
MECLDECHGECPLRRSELATIVAENLLHGDGGRYVLSDFVVMPNYVHALVQLAEPEQVKAQPRAWKHYAAVRINKELGRTGHFWQSESFDHLVRSEEQFQFLRSYIANNPAAARLRPGEYRHYARE